MVKKIEIEVTGDTRSLERALSKSQKSANSWEKGLSAAAKGGAVALAGLGVAAVYSVNAASNLSEQINKTNVVFRGSEKQIQQWSETTAESLGISQRAALEAAGTFGNMLVPMGIARDKAGQMSTKMVALAADMASFNNASPEETLDALRAGLAGETEPLRRFGVFLNEARINQEALNLGLSDGKRQLTAAEKATATYSIIMKDTADTQGDFARTSDSLANQQRILKAELEDTAAQLGTALIPAATGAASALLDLVNWTKENETAAKALGIGVAALSAGLILANTSLKIYTAQTLIAIGATRGLRIAMAATPWGLAAVAAAGLVEFLMSQGKEADKATEAQNDLAEAVRNYHRAVQEGDKARKDLESSNLRLEAASISVKRAQEARTEVMKDEKHSLLDLREADLRVSQALAEQSNARSANTAAQNLATTSMHRGKQAADEMAAATATLTEKYQKTLIRTREGKVATEGLAGATNRLRQRAIDAAGGVDQYANKLRGMANVTRDSNPQLARTQSLMADLAQAWGRVVSMPAAKAFVARFSVFTTVETTRTIPKQAGGPVTAGKAYIVGEKRPEVFVPNQSGRIVPNINQVGGGTNGGGSGGRMQLALVAVGPDILRELRELERRGRMGGSLA